MQISYSSDIVIQNGIVYNTRTITDATLSPFNLNATDGSYGGYDHCIRVMTSNALTINLPDTADEGLENGRVYYIFSGISTTSGITVFGNGNDIYGSDRYIITSGYNSMHIMYSSDLGEWLII